MRILAIAASFPVITAAATVSFIAPTVFGNEQQTARANPSPAESITAKVDKLFAEWNRSGSPGCSLGVSQKGVLVYERGYGTANLELGVGITPASVFQAASISKPFTAMSILLLAQRGQLSLDDEVRKHIPEWADQKSRLTIRHLLNHTGGLRDVFLLLELAAPRSDGDLNERLVDILARQRGLNFTPGSEYEYNNGGYTLLAGIVKRVSGQSLRAFADANIFKPLGMTHTHFHDDVTMIVPNRAWGYHRGAEGLQLVATNEHSALVGNSGLFTTARDLLLWEHNFTDVRVGDPALIAAMQTPAVLTGGDRSSYGLGLEIGQHRGLRAISHSGGGGGFAANLVRYPDHGLAVAVLCNVDNVINPVALTRSVAEIYLADVLTGSSETSATTTPPTVALSADQLADKAGLYRDRPSGTYGRIFVRDGKLMAVANAGTEGDTFELVPVSANRFVIPGTPIVAEFVPAGAGRTQEIHVTGVGPKPLISLRVKEGFGPSRAELGAFAGQYTNRELEVTYTLAPRDSGLVLRIPGRAAIVLQPIFRDAFHGPLVDVAEFSRDARGAVTGFTVRTSGARSLRFDRVKP